VVERGILSACVDWEVISRRIGIEAAEIENEGG